jgi:uncharacterized protein
MTLNRREMLLAAGAALLGPGVAGRALAQSKKESKKVLFFTKSAGFQHSVIARKGDQLSMAERILTDVGKDHGFEVVASKDGRLFDPDKIGQWDAFAFETTLDLTTPGTDKTPPMSKDGKQAFLDAIHGGKGFVGMHCATDTFHSKGDEIDPYIKMIGAEFITHGEQQVGRLNVVDPDFPGVKAFGRSFEINDEWYALKHFADDLHVIIAHDTKGMKGKMYQRPPFPETWCRMHGKGRVFYTSMGHREDVWENPKYQGLLMGALAWATGKVDASVEPNIEQVTPGYKEIPA